MNRSSLLLVVVLLAPARAAEPTVQFTRDILPILSEKCFKCHGPDDKTRRGNYRLDQRTAALKGGQSGKPAIVSKHPEKSELIRRLHSDDKNEVMPPPSLKKPLTAREKELIAKWIEEAVSYAPHWAFHVPKRPPTPIIKNTKADLRNPIDAFIVSRLEKEGLTASPEADRYALARRVSLDLTGLPPTIAEADRFVNDPSPDAYERYVDYLLNKPAFGEHWASLWMDLGRYADSNGYAQDGPRVIWPWRDWLIKAINSNKPFDEFTVEMLAGDLIKNATQDQMVATGFHRNTLTNEEGGTNDEEFRTAAVVDRVNTTFQVWMGLTMGCAQCHTHKYDPITQEEYFKVYAILNQTEDADRGDNSPFLTLTSKEEQALRKDLTDRIAALEKSLLGPNPKIDAGQKAWEENVKVETLPQGIQKIMLLPVGARTDKDKMELARYYRTIAPEVKVVKDQIAALKKELAGRPNITSPILRELTPDKKRKTHILLRGNFLDKGPEVGIGLPASLVQKPFTGGRLEFARWVGSQYNPLTARVIVNRYWEQLFGLGIVETVEDFGVRGKEPSHPELLDWLATELVRLDWDMKRFLKVVVMSATYRQSSKVTPQMLEHDPQNRLLTRGPRHRASAETVRDQALTIGGLLSAKMYGPSVRPPRPKLGLNAAFGGSTDWDPSPGEDRYRRGLYTTIRRTAPFPSMTTFDAPDRNFCTLTRPKTNTPLQALVTLNDPVYVEAAQALARRVLSEGGKTVEERASYAFRLALTRPPKPEELKKLVELFGKAHKRYSSEGAAALQLATDPLGPVPQGMEAVDLAAWTVIGNVLLNLDETVNRR